MLVPRTLASVLITGLTAVLVAGCGSPVSSSTSGAPTGPAPMPIDQRVVPGNLAGMAPVDGVQTATTPDDYAKLVNPDDPENPDLASQRADDAGRASQTGFVAGAVKNFGNDDTKWGTSVAVQTASPEQAKVYEQRLYDEQFGLDVPADAAKGTLAGPAASHTLFTSADDEGTKRSFALASFVDGPFVYVLVAGGESPDLTPEAAKGLIDEAAALYLRVKGHPAT